MTVGAPVIVTLTPNPSLDRTIEIAELGRGEVLRASASRVDPGGKGVNVSRVLAAHSVSTVAIVAAGGPEGAQLADLLAPAGIPVVTVPLRRATRSNIALVEPDGTTTKVNEAGPTLSDDEVATMSERVAAVSASADWVVLSGSLPCGVSPSYYADLVRRAQTLGCRVAVDTRGAPLAAAVAATPDLIKPNTAELAELTGASLLTWGDVVKNAEALHHDGIATVLVSLGEDGALLVDGDGTRWASAPAAEVRSTVGAGYSTLAGFLAAGARGDQALRSAVAFGAAAVALPGSAMPEPGDVHPDHVVVHDTPDPSRPLREAVT